MISAFILGALMQIISTTATLPGGILTHSFHLLPRSMLTFSMTSCTQMPCEIDIIMSSTRMRPASLQFEVHHPPLLTIQSVAIGSAGLSANKMITCAALAKPENGQRCIVTAINDMLIGSGVIARIDVTTTSSGSLTLQNVIAANQWARLIDSVVTPGGGAITIPSARASYYCNVSEIEPGEETTCTVELEQPQAADSVIAITTSDNSKVEVPASSNVIVPAGTVRTNFKLRAK